MKLPLEILSLLVAFILVISITIVPHEVQTYLIDNIDLMLNALLFFFSSSDPIFDTRLFVSNFGHLAVFSILGYIVARLSNKYSIVTLLSCLIIITLISEMSQFFISGREPSSSDLIINITAVSAGFMAYLQRNQPRRRASKSP